MPQTNPQFRLSRLNLFLMDFRDAQKFARYFVRKKLHAVKNQQAVAKLVHLAFNTSLVAAYSRPFHKSNDEIRDGKKVRVWLRDAIDLILDTEVDKALHDKIIKLRDETFAHSDSASREIEGFNYEGNTVLFYKAPVEVITREETRQLGKMIEKWIVHLDRQRFEMKAEKARARASRAG
jgi:hypothetical protein